MILAPDVVYIRDAPLHRIPLLICDSHHRRNIPTANPYCTIQRQNSQKFQGMDERSTPQDMGACCDKYNYHILHIIVDHNYNYRTQQSRIPHSLSGLVEYEEIFWLVIHVFRDTKVLK